MPAAAFIVPAVASVVSSVIGAHAASSAASQQKQAGQAAAATYQPIINQGNAALNKADAMYGIAGPVTQGVQNAAQAMMTPPPGQTPGGLAAMLIAKKQQQERDSQAAAALGATRPNFTPDQPPPRFNTMADYGTDPQGSY